MKPYFIYFLEFYLKILKFALTTQKNRITRKSFIYALASIISNAWLVVSGIITQYFTRGLFDEQR